MARSVTIRSIIGRARTHADQRNSDFVDDDEALELFNEIWPEVYDELVSIDDNYYATDATPISISNGASSYALPTDFYKLIHVDYSSSSNGDRISLQTYNEADRNMSFSSSTNLPSGYVYIKYIPAPTVYTSLDQTVDGIAGWDRLCSLRLAIDMADAEETNSDRLQRKYDQRLQSMRSVLERDRGSPGTVSDVSRMSGQYIYSTVKYRLYGNSINFISTEVLTAAIFGGPFV